MDGIHTDIQKQTDITRQTYKQTNMQTDKPTDIHTVDRQTGAYGYCSCFVVRFDMFRCFVSFLNAFQVVIDLVSLFVLRW